MALLAIDYGIGPESLGLRINQPGVIRAVT